MLRQLHLSCPAPAAKAAAVLEGCTVQPAREVSSRHAKSCADRFRSPTCTWPVIGCSARSDAARYAPREPERGHGAHHGRGRGRPEWSAPTDRLSTRQWQHSAERGRSSGAASRLCTPRRRSPRSERLARGCRTPRSRAFRPGKPRICLHRRSVVVRAVRSELTLSDRARPRHAQRPRASSRPSHRRGACRGIAQSMACRHARAPR